MIVFDGVEERPFHIWVTVQIIVCSKHMRSLLTIGISLLALQTLNT